MTITVTTDNKEQRQRKRARRTPAVSRQIALDAAQRLLMDGGPAAVTLKRVAQATGMSHGNITHHFGTVSALHAALISRVANELSVQAKAAVDQLRAGNVGAREVVDLVFSVFADSGCGRLIGWLSSTGEQRALAPLYEALRHSVQAYRDGEPKVNDGSQTGAGPIALELVSYALTASLMGESLEAATDMPLGSLRRLAVDQLASRRAT